MSKIYLCLKCMKIYDNESLAPSKSPYYKVCPDLYCDNREMFEIDENMIPIIIKLNDKGFKTKFCCSGHVFEPLDIYVKFDDNLINNINMYIRLNLMPKLPEFFMIEGDSIRLKKRGLVNNEFKYFTVGKYNEYMIKSFDEIIDISDTQVYINKINYMNDCIQSLYNWIDEIWDISKYKDIVNEKGFIIYEKL